MTTVDSTFNARLPATAEKETSCSQRTTAAPAATANGSVSVEDCSASPGMFSRQLLRALLHILELIWEISLWGSILDVLYQPEVTGAAVVVIFTVQG